MGNVPVRSAVPAPGLHAYRPINGFSVVSLGCYGLGVAFLPPPGCFRHFKKVNFSGCEFPHGEHEV